MTSHRHRLVCALALLACAVSLTATRARNEQRPDQGAPQPATAPLDDRALGDALCPIVYQVDRSPSPRGYRYIFYGNGFFINKSGYLLTAAHVLSQLRGGQPSLLLRTAGAAPRFVQAAVVAIDRDHDVALLLATPNPFSADFAVSSLPLDGDIPKPGRSVLAAAVRPVKPRDAYTLDSAIEERSPGEVLDYEFSELAKGPVDTELFLFGHAVQPGQSGAPVLSLDSHEVVGLVEGQWLRDSATALAAPRDRSAAADTALLAPGEAAATPGAVIPIHYAIALLQQRGVDWRRELEHANSGDATDQTAAAWPAPLSLIAPPYPQSLFGGEVVLDALIGHTGTLSDIKVGHGDEPFLDKALAAIRTWTFAPPHSDASSPEPRIAIVFQFVQPYVPPRSSTVHHYDVHSPSATRDSSAVPLTTVEPLYPATGGAEGSVILYESIDREGRIASVQVAQGLDSLSASALAAAKEWRFAPAGHSGSAIESAAIVVFTFRHPLATSHAR
ncbi:MAG TPA: energy transducer TonB [Candidatus Bathyarchaeia archaeon]|nr:energy transducer TonB [Candidatus Bathyarchaeia archaeon]